MFINKREVKISIPLGSKQSNFSTIKSQRKQGSLKPIHQVTFWRKIKTWLFPRLKESERLTVEYFEAEIYKRQSEAAKITTQAKKITAQIELLKQKEVLEFNKNINEIFRDDGLPTAAKYLKLAKVLENNPHVLEHFKNVKKITENTEFGEQNNIVI